MIYDYVEKIGNLQGQLELYNLNGQRFTVDFIMLNLIHRVTYLYDTMNVNQNDTVLYSHRGGSYCILGSVILFMKLATKYNISLADNHVSFQNTRPDLRLDEYIRLLYEKYKESGFVTFTMVAELVGILKTITQYILTGTGNKVDIDKLIAKGFSHALALSVYTLSDTVKFEHLLLDALSSIHNDSPAVKLLINKLTK